MDSWATAKCLEQLSLGHSFFQEMELEIWVGTRLTELCSMTLTHFQDFKKTRQWGWTGRANLKALPELESRECNCCYIPGDAPHLWKEWEDRVCVLRHTSNMDHFHVQSLHPLLKGQFDEWEKG